MDGSDDEFRRHVDFRDIVISRARYVKRPRLFATPAFHHWHHTRVDHIDRNFAPMLPLIDRLFGTHYLSPQWPAAYGIEVPMAAGFGGQLIELLLSAKKTAPTVSAPDAYAWPQ